MALNKMATEEETDTDVGIPVQCIPVATTPFVEKRSQHTMIDKYQADQTMMTRYTYEVTYNSGSK